MSPPPGRSVPALLVLAGVAAVVGVVLLLPGERAARRAPVTRAIPVGVPERADSGNTPPSLLAALASGGAGLPAADQVRIDLPVPTPEPEMPAVPEARQPEPVPDAPIDTLPPPPDVLPDQAGVVPAPLTADPDAPASGTPPAEGAGAGELVPPVVLKAAWLEYPREARRRKSEGEVEVRILVDTSGGVSAVEVERGAGDPTLNRAAIDAAHTMRFRAAHQSGRPVAVWFNYQFSFRLPS